MCLQIVKKLLVDGIFGKQKTGNTAKKSSLPDEVQERIVAISKDRYLNS